MRRRLMQMSSMIVAAMLAVAVLLVGCGGPSVLQHAAPATMDVDMEAMTFKPSQLKVTGGQTVTFRFHNRASVVHEAVIGDVDTQVNHEQDMRGMGSMNMKDMGGDNVVTVRPGASQTLVYHFTQPGPLIIGCHEPGHYAAGMRADVTVG